MDSLAGIAVLAVVGLWLAYLVPHRLRQRQQMLESRVNDRFSGNLRVLAVATADAAAPTASTRKLGRRSAAVALHSHGDCTTTSSVNAPLLTPPHGMTVRPRRHPPEGEQDMEHTISPTLAVVPARSGLHARRAAAARRRALLTVTLLLLTAVTGVLAATTALSAWFVLAPAALLLAVLALGRRAVRANARADAAWEARERARRAAAAASDDVRLAGRPAPVVRPRVTGRAVKSSQSHTQMIARVRPPGEGAGSSEPAASEPSLERARLVATISAPRAASSAAPAGAGAAASTARERGSSAATSETPASATPVQTAAAGDATEWTSVPVPRPVYTMKSAAPRWEPAPLTAEMAQITLARRAELAAGDGAAVVTLVVEQPEDEASASAESEASSDSLGVNLNSVLARRRAAGE